MKNKYDKVQIIIKNKYDKVQIIIYFNNNMVQSVNIYFKRSRPISLCPKDLED